MKKWFIRPFTGLDFVVMLILWTIFQTTINIRIMSGVWWWTLF